MHSPSRRLLLSGLRRPSSGPDTTHFHSSTSFPHYSAILLSKHTTNDAFKNRFNSSDEKQLFSRMKAPCYLATNIRHNSSHTSEQLPEPGKLPKDPVTAGKLTQELQDELRELNHIRALVSQLYMALHVPDSYQAEIDALRKQLEEIRTELQPLEEKKIQLLMRAEQRSKLLAWAGLGFMGMQFGFLARLTWWEYSWDIIEPVTYFVTYGTAMGLYAYFLVTRQDVTYQGVTERWTAVAFHKNVKRSKWEMNRYVQLKDKLAQIQTEVDKMNLLLPRALASAPAASARSSTKIAE